MFGLSASPKGRSDRSDILTEGLFGPVIHRIGYQDAVMAGTVVPMEVWMFDAECHSLAGIQSELVREREGLWKNQRRNWLIQQVVSALPKSEKILIMVKTVEHGARLKCLLPEFTLVYNSLAPGRRARMAREGILEQDAPLSIDTSEALEQFQVGTTRRVIATMVWQEGLDVPDLRYLIRADGMSGSIPAIQIGGRLSRISPDSGKDKGILIDFNDYAVFPTRTSSRRTHYRHQGWKIIDTDLEKLKHAFETTDDAGTS
jgi:superfamily II DNA or RNA helicase